MTQVRGASLTSCIFLSFFVGINGGTASGGILLNANGRYLESIQFRGVLVYRFTNGTGLKFWADNGGAVTYSSFYDVRIRYIYVRVMSIAISISTNSTS